MSQGTETPAAGRDEDALDHDAEQDHDVVAPEDPQDLPRPRVDLGVRGRHRAEPEHDEDTDGEDAVTGAVTGATPAPRRAPTPPGGFAPQGFRPGPPPGGFRPGAPTGGFRPGPPSGTFPAGAPTGGFPAGPRRPGPYGPFDPPSHPGRGYAPGPVPSRDASWDQAADDEDDRTSIGGVPAVLSLVLAVVGILVSCRPLVFGSTAMAPDTYVAIALSVVALVLGVVGALRPLRRPVAVLGIVGAIVALMVVAVIPTLPL